MPTVHLIIKGRVQGVFFRASAREKANELGITGWVKNTEEGDVETKAHGGRDQLDAYIAWCRKGPSKALVTEVDINDLPEESFESFRILR